MLLCASRDACDRISGDRDHYQVSASPCLPNREVLCAPHPIVQILLLVSTHRYRSQSVLGAAAAVTKLGSIFGLENRLSPHSYAHHRDSTTTITTNPALSSPSARNTTLLFDSNLSESTTSVAARHFHHDRGRLRAGHRATPQKPHPRTLLSCDIGRHTSRCSNLIPAPVSSARNRSNANPSTPSQIPAHTE